MKQNTYVSSPSTRFLRECRMQGRRHACRSARGAERRKIVGRDAREPEEFLFTRSPVGASNRSGGVARIRVTFQRFVTVRSRDTSCRANLSLAEQRAGRDGGESSRRRTASGRTYGRTGFWGIVPSLRSRSGCGLDREMV